MYVYGEKQKAKGRQTGRRLMVARRAGPSCLHRADNVAESTKFTSNAAHLLPPSAKYQHRPRRASEVPLLSTVARDTVCTVCSMSTVDRDTRYTS